MNTDKLEYYIKCQTAKVKRDKMKKRIFYVNLVIFIILILFLWKTISSFLDTEIIWGFIYLTITILIAKVGLDSISSDKYEYHDATYYFKLYQYGNYDDISAFIKNENSNASDKNIISALHTLEKENFIKRVNTTLWQSQWPHVATPVEVNVINLD